MVTTFTAISDISSTLMRAKFHRITILSSIFGYLGQLNTHSFQPSHITSTGCGDGLTGRPSRRRYVPVRAMIYLVLLVLVPSISIAEQLDCDEAKLSYLLERAVVANDLQATKFALELGANPDGVSEPTAIACFNGMPTSAPVMHAAAYQNTDILEVLLKSGASPNRWCCDSSALQAAEGAGNQAAAMMLREYGAR